MASCQFLFLFDLHDEINMNRIAAAHICNKKTTTFFITFLHKITADLIDWDIKLLKTQKSKVFHHTFRLPFSILIFFSVNHDITRLHINICHTNGSIIF